MDVREQPESTDDVRDALVYLFGYYNNYNLFEAKGNHLQTKYKLKTGFCELFSYKMAIWSN